ncbi:hypothetical protein J6590_075456 [Homalodisca vitripennis]|nr:hypothetical protein J6590_075456 [Homalodisca vitripennis]
MSNEPTHLSWRLQDSVTVTQDTRTRYSVTSQTSTQNGESTVAIVRTSLEWLSHHLVPDVVIDVPREHTSDATKQGKFCCNCENIIGVALAPPGPLRRDRCPRRTYG